MIRIETSVRRDRVIFAVIGRIQKKAMYDAKSFVTILFLVANLAGAKPAIAAEDASPPLATSHEVNVLRRVAAALSRQGLGLSTIFAVRRSRTPTSTGSTLPRQEWIAALLEPLCLSYAAALRSTDKKSRLRSLE
jgi:hypothetical protein